MIAYQLTDNAPFYPRACICGSGVNGDALADTFIERADMRVYVCRRCAHFIGALFGMLPPDEVAKLNDLVAEQAAEIDQLRERVGEIVVGDLTDIQKAMRVVVHSELEAARGDAVLVGAGPVLPRQFEPGPPSVPTRAREDLGSED